jgi:hypothetical protein
MQACSFGRQDVLVGPAAVAATAASLVTGIKGRCAERKRILARQLHVSSAIRMRAGAQLFNWPSEQLQDDRGVFKRSAHLKARTGAALKQSIH